jgi:hypothetical protein
MSNHEAVRAATVSAVNDPQASFSFGRLNNAYLHTQNPDCQQHKTPTTDIYPERPGFKARGTSEEAAGKVAGYSEAMRKAVLNKLAEFPNGLTADELANALGISPFSARPRLSELKRLGEVVATGERRKNASGMTATVWKVAGTPPWQQRGAA